MARTMLTNKAYGVIGHTYVAAMNGPPPRAVARSVAAASNGGGSGGHGMNHDINSNGDDGPSPAAAAAAAARHPVLESLKNSNDYNPKTFDVNPKGARFFVIKSFSEDDIHRRYDHY